MDYARFKNHLTEIAGKLYDGYKSEHGIKDICGFALYSDGDAMSISVALNTCGNLENNIRDDPENGSDYKFNPEEWSELFENDELEQLNKTLGKESLKVKKKQFAEHREKIHRLCLETLDELKGKGLFNGLEEDFVLLFSVSDFEVTETMREYNRKETLNKPQKSA